MDPVVYGDPDQMWLIPLKNGIYESYFRVWDYIVSLSSGLELLTTVTIIADEGNNDIRLNDINISGDFLPFPGDARYKYLQMLIDMGEQYHLVSAERISAYCSSLYEQGGISYALSDVATKVESLAGQSDTLYICGTTTLNGHEGMLSYLWSTGATTPAIDVSEEGTYWVQANIGCSYIADTFYIIVAELPDILPSDTLLCNGDSLLLNAYQDYFTAYQWSTGDTTAAITISAPGTYIVTAYTESCGGLSDTFNIYTPPLPVAILPGDTILCDGLLLTLEAYQDGSAYYRWNTQQAGCCITVDSSGLYWLEVMNRCMEKASDSIQVSFIGCTDCLLVPNAFSPNGDGLNDKFTVQTTCLFDSYRLAIFNRYGQRIFISYNPENGWDGTYNGLPADVGVYFYQVEAIHFIENAGTFREKGDLTLIR